jgi:hypothetical protein
LSMIDLVVSPATPSNTARSGGIVLPIIESLSDTFGSKVSDGTEDKIGSYLVFNEFHANTISSSLFMTASAPNVAAVGLAAANGVKISWFGWVAAAIVPALISFILVPIIIYKMYPPKIKETPNAKEWADGQLKEMGAIKASEKVMMAVFILALVLWMLSSFIGLDATWIAFLATALLLVTGVLTTKDMLSETGAWNVVVWFSILIFMANQLSLMTVSPALGLSPAVPGPASEQSGAFRITTPTFNSLTQQYNAGMAVKNMVTGDIVLSNFVNAEPNKNIDCQPVMIFYVAVGSYEPGSVINFSESSVTSAVCDATTGFTSFDVVYNPDGTWTVVNLS